MDDDSRTPLDAPDSAPADRKHPHQPLWFSLALLAILSLTALCYGWGLSGNPLHSYYAPAVKSMSTSWRALLLASYDPAASVTLDKLPGALVIQSLFARVFGYHTWSLILPQVIEAVLTALVLFRSVRAWQGARAGLLAALGFTTMPIVAALARTQISDTLMTMLLVLAAGAWTRAVSSGRLRPLLCAGLLVGLAFQAKMVQAWGIAPTFGLVYLIAAPGSARRRLGHLGLAGALALAVSLAWVAVLALVPPDSRPYVDGSTDNSALSMVFEHNLLSRYRGQSAFAGYLLLPSVASQVGWLYPLALVGLVTGLLTRRGQPRTDPIRAGTLMWGGWLFTYAIALSTGYVAHSYYVITIAPAIAALAAAGARTLWAWYRRPTPSSTWLSYALPGVAALTVIWSVRLSGRFPTFLPWVATLTMIIGACAVLLLVAAKSLPGSALISSVLAAAGGATALLAVLLAPAAWAISTKNSDYAGLSHCPEAGPGPGRGPNGTQRGGGALDLDEAPEDSIVAVVSSLKARAPGSRYLLAVAGATQAGRYLMTGASILPMFGYSGRLPFPTVEQVANLVATGQLRYLVLEPKPPVAHGENAGLHQGTDADGATMLSPWLAERCSTLEVAGTVVFDCAAAQK